ncbi:Phage integrase, partial [mine drainage metagenome]
GFWLTRVLVAAEVSAPPGESHTVYNRAQHLPERIAMMQAWSDYLDALRKGADVVPIRRPARPS